MQHLIREAVPTAVCVFCAGFVDEKHNFPGSVLAYCSDGAGIVVGSLMGTSPITVFVGVCPLSLLTFLVVTCNAAPNDVFITADWMNLLAS